MNQTQKNNERYRAALERIRRDGDLNAGAKMRRMGEAYSEAAANHARIVEEDRARVGEAYDRASRSVFGLALPHGTTGAERIAAQANYRDALFRVSQIGPDDTADLHRLQKVAAMTGDRPLMRAVLYRGYELEDRGVIEAVAAADPEMGRAWEEFMDAAEELNAAESDPVRYAGPDRPPELDGALMPAPATEAG